MDRYHIVPVEVGWAFQRDGAEQAAKVTETREELLRLMPVYMAGKDGTLILHRADGSVERELSYPSEIDPFATPE
ncbi:DUF2188 domain-containing protein [Phytopseudomonas dryadis]|uniref:DUF2188 domain-containing protein n=1 Tax=Pseudomonadaceae TaxID=135621 RepID=UPI0013F153CE|nr:MULTISPECIES: DUF2188 domain-containing protein [Pseudomonas]